MIIIKITLKVIFFAKINIKNLSYKNKLPKINAIITANHENIEIYSGGFIYGREKEFIYNV